MRLGVELAAVEQGHPAEHGVERIAQLMGDHGDEFVFGAVGLLGQVARLLLADEADPLLLHPPVLDGVADRALETGGADLPLDQVVGGAGAHGLQVDLLVPLTGHQDDWGDETGSSGAALPRFPQELEPRARAEPEIEEADVEMILQDPQEPPLVGGRPFELEAVAADLGQQIAGEDVIVLVVLDQEHPDAVHGQAGSSTNSTQ